RRLRLCPNPRQRNPRLKSLLLNRSPLQCAPNRLNPERLTWAHWLRPPAAERGKLFRREECLSAGSLEQAISRRSPIRELEASAFTSKDNSLLISPTRTARCCGRAEN